MDQSTASLPAIDWAIKNILQTHDLVQLIHLDESLHQDIHRAVKLNISESNRLLEFHEEYASLSSELVSMVANYVKKQGFRVLASSYVDTMTPLDDILEFNYDKKNIIMFQKRLLGTICEKVLYHPLADGVIFL
jgi:hypothetical protein